MKRLRLMVAVMLMLLSVLAIGQKTVEKDSQTITVSGSTLQFQDGIGTQTNSFEMVVSGSPATVTVTIQGCMRSLTCTGVASSSSTTNVIIGITGGPYDYYSITGSWTGGSSPSLKFNRTGSSARSGSGSGSSSSTVIQSGLLAEYRLTEGSGTTIVDYSVNGNTGTFGGGGNAPSWVSGSGGLLFSGGQFVTLPSAVNASLTIQIFGSFQPLATQIYQAPIIGNGTANVSQNGIIFAGRSTTAGDSANNGIAQVKIFGAGGAFKDVTRGGFSGVGLISETLDTVAHIYINGSEVPSYDGASQLAGNINGTGVYQLGGAAVNVGAGAITYLTGTIYYAIFYNRVLTATEIAQNNQVVQNAMLSRGVIPITRSLSSIDLLVGDGDSITVGQNAAPYSQFVVPAGTWNVTNVGKNGLTVPNLISAGSISVDSSLPSNAQGVDIVWAGTNDLAASVPAQTVLNNLAGYSKQRRAQGWKVIVTTTLSSNRIGGFDALKNSLNVLIRQNWKMFADGLADVAANVNVGADGSGITNIYFFDGLHPTNFSQRNIISPIMQKAVNVLQGASDFSNATTYTITAPAATAITATSESTNTCTITSTLNPPLGSMVTITGVTPAGYNGTYFVLTTSATNFTVFNSTTGLGVGTVFGAASIPMQQDGDAYLVLGGSATTPNFTLETCVGYTGQNIYIKHSNTTSPWTVTPFASETIDGAATLTMPTATSGNNPVVVLQSVLISAAAAGCNWKRMQ